MDLFGKKHAENLRGKTWKPEEFQEYFRGEGEKSGMRVVQRQADRKILRAAVPGPALAAALAVPGLVVALAAPFPALGAEPGWSKQEDGWHYYFEDGSPATGWVEVEGKSYYIPANGGMLKDTITPDGYYVDRDGAWYERTEMILETEFRAPRQVRNPSSEWSGKEALNGMKSKLSQKFSGNRSFRVGDNAIEFVKIETTEGIAEGISSAYGKITSTLGSTSSSGSQSAASDKTGTPKETVLLGLYREPGQGRYRIDIRAALDGERAESSAAASCNYEVFRAMAYQVSSVPELLTNALYSAWEEENLWRIGREQWTRIGDCEVKYGSGDGYGRFYIRPVG